MVFLSFFTTQMPRRPQDTWKFKTKDPWTEHEQVPELDCYQRRVAKLIQGWNEALNRMPKNTVRSVSIPEDIDELRAEYRRLFVENRILKRRARSLEKQNIHLESLAGTLQRLIYNLFYYMGLPRGSGANPYLEKEATTPKIKIAYTKEELNDLS